MATISEQIAQRVSQTIEGQRGDIAKGAQLAQQVQQVQINRQKLEQAKQQIKNQKITKFTNAVERGVTIKDPQTRKAFLNKFVPKLRDSLGLQDVFSDDVLEFTTASDENLGRFLTLKNQVQSGGLSVEDAIGQLQDPEQFVQIAPMRLEEIGEAGEFQIKQETQRQRLQAQEQRFQTGEQRRQQQIQRQEVQFEQRQQATLDKELRQRTKDLSKELNRAGIPTIRVTFDNLNKVIPGGIDNYTGENIPGIGGGAALVPIGRLTKEGRRMRQLAIGLGNQILKLRSGAQINESEARRILSELGIDQAVGEGGGVSAVFRGTRSDQDFVNGVRDARRSVNAVETNLAAGFGNDAAAALKKERRPKGKQAKVPRQITKADFEKFNAAKQKRFAEKNNTTVEAIKERLGIK